MIRNQILNQIREIKAIRGDQITEIGNNKIEIIHGPMKLVHTKKTLITIIRIKENLNKILEIKISKNLKIKFLIEKNLKKTKKIIKLKTPNQNHRLESKLIISRMNKMRKKFKVNQSTKN